MIKCLQTDRRVFLDRKTEGQKSNIALCFHVEKENLMYLCSYVRKKTCVLIIQTFASRNMEIEADSHVT